MVAHGIADYLSSTSVASAWNARHCNVISVMRKWYEFEPTAGTYNFGNLKNANDGIKFAHDNGISLLVRFMAGADSPIGRPGVSTGTINDWLNRSPHNVPRFRTFDNDAGGQTADREFWMPHLWNATYIARYLLAVDQWNTWFESNCPGGGATHKVATHIVAFTVSGPTENGAEMSVSPGQRHRYSGGTTTWPVGYGADYNNPQTLSGTVPASGNIINIPSTAAFTVPGLFKISTSSSTAYAATEELVYATSKTATRLNVPSGGRGFSGTTAQSHASGKVVRQADQSNPLAVHLGTYNGVTGLYDHSRRNAAAWIAADGLATYAARQTQLGDLWEQNIIDVLARLTTVRAYWGGGGVWGDAHAAADATLETLGPVYRERLMCCTQNLQAKPPRTSSSQPVPTYADSLPPYYSWLRRGQTLGCSVGIQTGGTNTTGSFNGQQIIDACETGWQEFGESLEYIETNGSSRFTQNNGGAGWDTWAAHDWPGGQIADLEDYFVSFNNAEPDNLQDRIAAAFAGTDVTGAATLTGTGSASITGRRTRLGRATLTGVGSVSISGVAYRLGRATLAGTGSSSSAGSRTLLGAATFQGAGSAAGTGSRTRKGEATLAGTSSQTAAGAHLGLGAATLVGISDISPAWGTTYKVGSATLTGNGSASVDGRRTRESGAALSGTGGGSFAAAAVTLGAVTLTGVGASSSAGTRTRFGTATLAGAGSGGILSIVDDEDFEVDSGQLLADGISGVATGEATTGIGSSGAVVLTGVGRLLTFIPVEGAATLSGVGTERAEGAIVPSRWRQDTVVDDWEEWEDLLPAVATVDEEFVESSDNRFTADGTRLDAEVLEDADWDQTSTQEWAA